MSRERTREVGGDALEERGWTKGAEGWWRGGGWLVDERANVVNGKSRVKEEVK